MRMMTFAKRCAKEILRDPINLGFGLGFPLVLLVLLSAIQANIPVNLFEINTLTPGITVFGLSFMTLFSATLISKDRESALLQRLYTTPLTGFDFIMGYMKNNKDLFLSALEYRLLLVFINNRGVILTRNQLLDAIWDVAGEYVNDNTLTVYIKRLREKIEDDPTNPQIILTVRGIGYKVEV